MKRIANILTIAIASLTVFFASCSNSVYGTVSGVDSSSGAVVKKLTVVATSNDKIVSFGTTSRTITAGVLDSEHLKFYLWGQDTVNATNVNVKEVVFSGNGDGVSGSVPVDLGISNYKLYLAAVSDDDAASISLTENYTSDVAAVLAKSVLFANSNVDLRYNQIVKFYLSPFNLSGNGGDITLTLKTVDLDSTGTEASWSNTKYRVLISLQNVNDSSVVSVVPTISKANSSDAADLGAEVIDNDTNFKNKVWVQTPLVTDTNPITPAAVTGWGALASDGLKYSLSGVPSGTYNLVIDFTDGKKHFYYSEKVLVLVNQKIEETVKIPNVIAKKPVPVKNFQVGYNDPEDPNAGYYLATFQWDDKSNNEEYFILQLIDVSKDLVTTPHEDGTYLDLSADAVAALSAVSSDTHNAIVSDTYATDFATVKAAWDAEVTSAKLTSGKISGMSLDKYVYQKTDSLYAAGSLDKNSTTVSLWLPLGSVYMARICAYNDSCSDLGATDAEILVSDQEWLYSNSKALTSTGASLDNLATVYLSTGTDGIVTDSKTPVKWPKPEENAADRTSEEKDIPLAINRYRLTYNLNNGKFWQVKKSGKLNTVYNNENTNNAKQETFKTYETEVTANVANVDSYKTKIVEYHTVTSVGTSIIIPHIYEYTADTYATLFDGGNVWTCWKKGSVTGDKISPDSYIYRQITWKNVVETSGETLTNPTVVGEAKINFDITDTTFAASKINSDPSYYVNSAYGYVTTKGYKEGTPSPEIEAYTYEGVKKVSSDGSIVIRSTLANYMTFDNLSLFANFGATNSSVDLYSPYNSDLKSKNIRVTKSSDGTNYISANKKGTPNALVDGTYTDFELNGTEFIISSFYNNLRIAVVESSTTPIYKKVALEILETGSGSKSKSETVASATKYTVDDANKVGSGTDGKEPLALGQYTQYVFDKKVSETFLPGKKYRAMIYAYTDLNETAEFTYPLIIHVYDPKYSKFAECNGTNYQGSILYDFTGEGTPSASDLSDPTKFVRSAFSSYADANANSKKVYYGTEAAF